MSDQVKLYGEFTEMSDKNEYLIIKFRASTMNIDELWESGSLSASFLSSFWGTFFPMQHKDSKQRKAEMKDSVRYIAAELIGNAVKFSYEPLFLIRIALCMCDDALHFYVTNSVKPDDVENYQNFILNLLESDPDQLYLEQMEKNAMEENEESRMGFLTMILDHGANLAWKFEENKEFGIQTATTMARLPIVRD